MGDLKGCEVFTDHQQELYLRLQNYCFDAPGGAVTFAAKLACEQGWSVAKSERVLGEYRRFLFLAIAAGHPVSPSKAVDQAWHQHLLDTRNYWQEFCPRVLGRPLHHTPSRGGEEERQRLGECYRRTLASYRSCFGEAPPADLWPAAEAPAAVAPIAVPAMAVPPVAMPQATAPRLPRRMAHRWGMLLASLVIALVLGGCKAGYQSFPFGLNGPAFLLLYGLVTLVGCLEVKRQ
ncbi:MAG: glycine-rich domain-containing protein, partial [Cyanobacteriota bacterium]